jgi:hypothetical protein
VPDCLSVGVKRPAGLAIKRQMRTWPFGTFHAGVLPSLCGFAEPEIDPAAAIAYNPLIPLAAGGS